MKANCWEVTKCGKEKDCPAFANTRLNGAHDGKNAGRACWVVAGTMCGVAVQGTLAQKIGDCAKCEFYGQVKSEEGGAFMTVNDLQMMM
ncbi:MAG: hypothetical protein HY903_17840 [Deltaproteobacteria bacterium]|nr:hypothetical protein [Deltaproteobacteria bacterium]